MRRFAKRSLSFRGEWRLRGRIRLRILLLGHGFDPRRANSPAKGTRQKSWGKSIHSKPTKRSKKMPSLDSWVRAHEIINQHLIEMLFVGGHILLMQRMI